MSKIPDFKNEKEMAEFWDTHSVADFADELEEVKTDIDPELKSTIKTRAQSRLKMVSLRLREEQISAVKTIAESKDIPYQTLIRSWISAAIEAETTVKKKNARHNTKKYL